MPAKKTQEQFITSCRNVWGDKYDLSQIEYKGWYDKIKVICPEHGAWYPIANNFVRGHGCIKCRGEQSSVNLASNTEEFIAKAREVHGDKYDYSKVIYKNNKTKVTIICPEHGEFEQMPNSHLEGKGCRKCAQNEMSNNKDFIEKASKIHRNKYDYSLVEYCGNKTKVKIICPTHGVFEQAPNHHLKGVGCPHCQRSTGEEQVSDWLDEKGMSYIGQHKFSDCANIRKLPFDFYLPDFNCCIEYQGKQHYVDISFFGGCYTLESQQQRDQIKRDYCSSHGIKLIEIKYDEDVAQRLSQELKV